MSEYPDLPCGNCACGIYAPQAIEEGLLMFGGMQTQREALKAAPKCKHDQHICFGARDFILSCGWPLDQAQMANIRRQIAL